MMEIPLAGLFECVASSPCGRYIASGAGAHLVAKSSTGAILRRIRDHSDDVTCIAFAAKGKKILSGSRDKVMVWDLELSEAAAQVLEGHSGEVTGICANIDGGSVYSTSYDGSVRIWDAATGTETEKLSQGIAVCVLLLWS